MNNEMRYTTGFGGGPASDIIARAIALSGGWSISAMREPGFRMMQDAVNGDGFRAAAPLPEKAQVVLDKAVIGVGRDRLAVVDDFISRGLTYPLTDPLSLTQLEWYASDDGGNAQRTMSPSARGENSMPQLLQNRLPVYLTTAKFELDIRTLRMSQRMGLPLDTSLIEQRTRRVNEAIEDAMINGATTLDGQDLKVAGYGAPGLLNAPNAATKANLTVAAWTTSPVGATVYSEVQAMINLLIANKKYGPYGLYVGSAINSAFDADYDAVSGSRGLTIRERLMKIEGLVSIKAADLMTSGNASTHVGAKVALVQLTKDVVDVVVGQQPTVIPWTSLDGFTIHNLIMAIVVPRVRSDYNSKSGICVGTLA